MAVNGGVLEKVARLDAPGKSGLIQKNIIDSIALAGRGARVVHVMARVISGCLDKSCWHKVVFPPPEGADMTINKGELDTVGTI